MQTIPAGETISYLEEAQIASSGIFASLFLAFLALLIGEMFNFKLYSFANINFYLALFNMIPVSSLDGTQIFFGSRIIWSVLAFICLIFALYAFMLGAF